MNSGCWKENTLREATHLAQSSDIPHLRLLDEVIDHGLSRGGHLLWLTNIYVNVVKLSAIICSTVCKSGHTADWHLTLSTGEKHGQTCQWSKTTTDMASKIKRLIAGLQNAGSKKILFADGKPS